MINKNCDIVSGQIRHPLNFPDTILKCSDPIPTETYDNVEKTIELEMFFLTNDFPKPHYLVIDRLLDNYYSPTHKFLLVYLITHSDNFDNLKITKKLYDFETKIKLTNSYITRDTFLILTDNINNKVFGHFNIKLLRKELEY